MLQCVWRKMGNVVELQLQVYINKYNQIKVHPQLPSIIDEAEISILVPPFGTDQFRTKFVPANATLDFKTRSVIWKINERITKGQEKTYYAAFQLANPPPSFVDRPWAPSPAKVKLMCNTKNFIPFDISINGDSEKMDMNVNGKSCSWITTNYINQPSA